VAGVTGVALALLTYQRTSELSDELHRVTAAPASTATDDALSSKVDGLKSRLAVLEARPVPPATNESVLEEVRHLEARVAALEAHPAPLTLPPAPSASPSSTREPSGFDPASIIKDPQRRAEQQERVEATIDEYWRVWGAKHGLSDAQIEKLSAIEVEASRRKLENQVKLVNGELSQPGTRAENRAATDEVRRRAQELLTPEQLAQFNADKGAEWGSSYRMIREAAARTANAAH
jgi:hypothetical protein